MKKSLQVMRAFLLLTLVFSVSVPGIAQSFNHPGVMHTAGDLAFIKQKINNNEEPWKSAYEDFLTSKAGSYQGINPKPYSSLEYVHHPYGSVECGSYNNPNVGCNDMVYDGMAAYSLALRFYITEDDRYAAKAIEIIEDWSDVYRKNEESNSRLVVSWATPWYVNAGEILRYTPGSGWTNTNTNNLNTMLNRFKDYIFWEDRPANNWMMSSVEARLALAVFQNDRVAFDDAVDKWKLRVKTYIFQSSDGSQPIPPTGQTQSWTNQIWHDRNNRTGTIYVDGLCMETCRDISHTKLGATSLFNGAEIAWSQGIDLFDLERERFKDFLELHAPWMMGGNVPNNICDGYLDIVSEEAFEIAYNHLHDRLGINLPGTKQMLDRNRPNDANRWVTKWETMCYAERPFSNGAPTVEFASGTLQILEEGYTAFYIEGIATDPEGSIANVTLYIDGEEVRSESVFPYEWGHATSPNPGETVGMAPGMHTLRLVVVDNAGNTAEQELQVEVQAVDCHGDLGGAAEVDACGVCSGGNTGLDPNATCSDCNGDPHGTASVDACGVCSGGTTGVEVDACLACHDVIASGDDGNVPANTRDNDYNTRWSASGAGEYIEFCLDEVQMIDQVSIAFFKGDERQSTFDVTATTDGLTYETLIQGRQSSGTTLEMEHFAILPTEVWKLRVTGQGNSQNAWNSYTEIDWRKVVTTSLQDEKAEELSVFPNPSSDRLFVNGVPESTTWEVYDALGKSVKQGSGTQLGIEQLAEGLYFLKIDQQVFPFRKI